MLVTGLLLLGLTGISDEVLLSGVAASLKYFTDQIQGSAVNTSTLKSFGENTKHKLETSTFNTDPINPKTLGEYLTNLHNNDGTQSLGWGQFSNNQTSGKVVIIARIGDYDNETENNNSWKVVPDTLIKNKSVQNAAENGLNLDSSKSNETQKYIDDYQDLFFTFRDFVNIGVNPYIKRSKTEEPSTNQVSGKTINVTYIMPIPKTKKYFQIIMSNLTENQYRDINMLLITYFKNRTDIFPANSEDGIVYIDQEDTRRQVTSRDLTELDSLSTFPPDSMSEKQLPTNPEQAVAYFQSLFSEKEYGDLLEIIKTKSINTTSEPNTQTEHFRNTINTPLIKNNGFHAEISTDYVNRNGAIQENKVLAVNNSFSNDKNIYRFIGQQNQPKKQEDDISEGIIGTATTILNPVYNRRNTTKLLLQQRSKLPFSYHSSITKIKNTNSNITTHFAQNISNPGSQSVRNVLETDSVEIATPLTILTNWTITNDKGIPQMSTVEYVSTTPQANLTKLIDPSTFDTHQKDLMDTSELYKITMNERVFSSLSNQPPAPNEKINMANSSQDNTSLSVMQAANWILEMKKRLEEEDKKKNERYKSYIKQFLGGESGLVNLGKEEEGSSVMKINRQENTLEELKLLMVDYFTSMNFIDGGTAQSNSSLEVESIMNTKNIFELMNISSQLLKFNLQMKKQNNSKEPSGFVKNVVEKQVEKCSKFFNESLFSKDKQTTLHLLQKNKNRRFIMFTNCVNFKLQRCIKGFSIWLKKGRFYLRPKFQLRRAYENYEIERNLYCLRTFNASSLASNRHGMRVWPRNMVNRKFVVNGVRGKSRTKLQTRRLNNRDHKVRYGRNMQINRKSNNHQRNVQIRRQQPTDQNK